MRCDVAVLNFDVQELILDVPLLINCSSVSLHVLQKSYVIAVIDIVTLTDWHVYNLIGVMQQSAKQNEYEILYVLLTPVCETPTICN